MERSGRRLIAAAFLGVATAMGVASCDQLPSVDEPVAAAARTSHSTPAVTTASADTPVAFVTGPPSGGMDALQAGVLNLRDSCLLVEGRDGALILPVFNHARVSWDGQVLTWEGNEYRIGDRIDLGGGMGGDTSAEWVDYVPDGCAFDYVFSVKADP